jgi:beta-lactamase class A
LFVIVAIAALGFSAYRFLPGSETFSSTAGSQKQTESNKANSTEVLSKNDAGLQQLIETWRKKYSFDASVVVIELSGDMRTASYNATSSIVPGSTYKLYVAYAILHDVEQGKLDLHTMLTDGKTVQTDLQRMIVNSDNAAARTLGFYYGWKNINALLQSVDITHTDLYNYIPPSTEPQGNKYSTVSDLATLLQKLANGTLLNADNSELLISMMKQQQYRQRIPAGVPSGVIVADKPGWLSPADGYDGRIENDAAIVYGTKSTYILVIATTGSTTAPLTNLSSQVYDYLQQS